jgi:signal transduction histidine kinase
MTVRLRLELSHWVKLGLGLLVMVMGTATGHAASVVPGAAAVLIIELIPDDLAPGRARIAACALISCLTVGLSSGYSTSALPLLLFAALRAGEEEGVRAVVVERLLSGAALAVGAGLIPHGRTMATPVGALVQWWTLGLALGLLVSLAGRVQPASAATTQQAAARAAARLSERLQDVARDLPLGLDAAAVAQTLLDVMYADVPADVSAVLVRVDDNAVSPLALRGATRLPWRDPMRAGGALHTAWTTQRSTEEMRPGDDVGGRRRGSSTLCVPITDNRTSVGLAVLERRAGSPFTEEEVARCEEAAAWVASHLQAALHFAELQRSATMFEREQLAREMHNGVAQDLAFVGFGLDSLSRTVGADERAKADIAALREEVSRMMGDIRLSINELRGGIRPDQGLGRVLSSQIQHFGATTGTSVQVELRESPARLPVDVEMSLARLTHELLMDARTGKASSVRLTLDSEPPTALFVLEHDGETRWQAGDHPSPQLSKLDGCIEVLRPQNGAGLMVVVRVRDEAAETAPATSHLRQLVGLPTEDRVDA